MRVLLDECVPRRLSRELVGRHVRTVPEMGWAGKKNGELIQAMIGQGFEILVTVDRNLRYQLRMSRGRFGLDSLDGP